MNLLRSRRSVRIVAWLLTPVVAWAASFMGGWIGLFVGNRLSKPQALWWGIGGAVLGGILALAVWVLRLRAGAHQEAARRGGSPPPPEVDS